MFPFSALNSISLYGQTADFVNRFMKWATGEDPLSGTLVEDIINVVNNPFQSIANGFIDALTGVLTYLPDGGNLPSAVHEASQGLGGVLYNMSFIFPVYDLLAIILLTFMLKFTIFSLRIIIWGIAMVRGSAMQFPI